MKYNKTTNLWLSSATLNVFPNHALQHSFRPRPSHVAQSLILDSLLIIYSCSPRPNLFPREQCGSPKLLRTPPRQTSPSPSIIPLSDLPHSAAGLFPFSEIPLVQGSAVPHECRKPQSPEFPPFTKRLHCNPDRPRQTPSTESPLCSQVSPWLLPYVSLVLLLSIFAVVVPLPFSKDTVAAPSPNPSCRSLFNSSRKDQSRSFPRSQQNTQATHPSPQQ